MTTDMPMLEIPELAAGAIRDAAAAIDPAFTGSPQQVREFLGKFNRTYMPQRLLSMLPDR